MEILSTVNKYDGRVSIALKQFSHLQTSEHCQKRHAKTLVAPLAPTHDLVPDFFFENASQKLVSCRKVSETV